MPPSIPKLVGADFELGNFVLGLERSGGTGPEASRALLREVRGVSASRGGQLALWDGSRSVYPVSGYDVSDWGRRYLLENGGCIYIDLDHLELATPEVRSAWDHVAACHAMLRIARAAWRRANAKLPEGQRIQVLVNNSDGRSNSYGSHLSFLLSREAWRHAVLEKPHHLHFLATFQVSSLPFTGQGKVGAENGRPWVDYQLSQRADFFESVVGPQTTYARPLVNTRDEGLCAGNPDLARLHCIFFDAGLCHVSGVLKAGLMQIALALLEEECVPGDWLLEAPVDAVRAVSRDLAFERALPLASGKRATALELQARFLECAQQRRAEGGLEGVARVDELLELWQHTLALLEAGDREALATRLDWACKREILEDTLRTRPDLDWRSPELRYLDQLYASLDPEEGLYWAYEAAGMVERIVPEAAIAALESEPPEDTRAWTRAMLLRHFGANRIEQVDWDRVVIETADGGFPERLTMNLDDPARFTRAECESLFTPGGEIDEIA